VRSDGKQGEDRDLTEGDQLGANVVTVQIRNDIGLSQVIKWEGICLVFKVVIDPN
jgi:hypothetical protein